MKALLTIILMAWSVRATQWVEGNCPQIDIPKVDMQYMYSKDYPALASEGGECKFILKTEGGNGQYIKMESPQIDLKCGDGTYGIQVTDYSDMGVVTSKNFCDTNVIPLFVSSGIHMEVRVKYGMGDRFQIGFKTVGDKVGKFVKDYAPPPPPRPVRPVNQIKRGYQPPMRGNNRPMMEPAGPPLFPGLGPIPPRLGPRGQQMPAKQPIYPQSHMLPQHIMPPNIPQANLAPPVRQRIPSQQRHPYQTQDNIGIQLPSNQNIRMTETVTPGENANSETGGRKIDIANTRILMADTSGSSHANLNRGPKYESPQVQREQQRKAVVIIVVISMLAILLIGGCIVGCSVYKFNDN